MVFGNGLIHEFVGYRVVAETLQYVRQLVPHVDKVLLRLLGSEQSICIGLSLVDGIEIVRTDDVQVNDSAQVMLLCPIDGIEHQLPRLRKLVAFLIPELYLINWQTYEIEAQRVEACKVILLNMLLTSLTTLLAL